VAEVFGPTFQGEGPTAGQRASFVRLAHCNLDCSWCDTKFTWDWDGFDPAVEIHMTDVEGVCGRLDAMDPGRVVITGGEPLLQQTRLGPLLAHCAARGWPVEVETNGTIAPAISVAQFNVSPKLANSGIERGRRIKPDVLAAFMATGRAVFKFVVAGAADLDEIAGLGVAPVWVMPEGTTPEAILAGLRALADPVAARGWNLGTRLHVLVWGDERGR
jgi:organic radical activating enzyme